MIFNGSLSDTFSQVTSYGQDRVRTTNVESPLSKIFEPYSCYIYIAQELAHEGLELDFCITFDMIHILIVHNNSVVEASLLYE